MLLKRKKSLLVVKYYWITKDIKHQIILRDLSLKSFKRNSTSANWKSYTRTRNTVCGTIRKVKKKFPNVYNVSMLASSCLME